MATVSKEDLTHTVEVSSTRLTDAIQCVGCGVNLSESDMKSALLRKEKKCSDCHFEVTDCEDD